MGVHSCAASIGPPPHSFNVEPSNCLRYFFSSGGSFSASDISASTLNDGEGAGYVRALRVQFPSTVDLLASKVSSPHCLLAFLLVVAAILRNWGRGGKKSVVKY